MNRWKAALALTALWTSTALAQVTVSSTVYFPTGTNVLRVYSSKGYNAYKNSIGQVAKYVTRDANLDSLQEQKWSVTVTRQINIPQHIYEVLVEGVPFDPTQTINYKDTINIGSGKERLYLPNKDTRTTIGGSPFPFSRDSIFSIYAREDTLYAGDKTEILFTRFVPVAGSDNGSIINMPLITYDTLTIAEYDTLRGLKDTIYTRPFYVTHVSDVGAFIDMVPIASTGDTVRLAVQAKVNGSTSWYGGPGSKVRLLTVASFNDTTFAMTIPSDSLLLADSIRIAQIAEVNKGRNIIKRFFIKYFKK